MTDQADLTDQPTFFMHPEDFKRTLKRLGFSQAVFADYVGQNVRTVNDWGAPRPKNASKIKGTVRIGPPEYAVRIIRMLERTHIPTAPASQSTEQAIAALSVAFTGLLGTALAKDWTATSVAEALSFVGRQHGIAIQGAMSLDLAARKR